MDLAFLGAANSPHVIKFANTLSKEGIGITVYSMPDHKDVLGEIDSNINVRYLSVPSKENGAKKNAKELKMFLEQDNQELVNAFGIDTYGFLAVKAKVKKLLLTSSGLDIYRMDANGTKPLIIKAIQKASGIIAASANVTEKIKAHYKKDIKCFTVPFGVDIELFKKTEEKQKGIPRFGSLKFIEEYNGINNVIDAFYAYTKKYGDARLIVVGDGSCAEVYKQKVTQLGISDSVEFLGYIKNKDMPKIINSFDAVLQLSKEESFGVSGIEAMACEVPLIASDTDGASEYVLNFVTGYLVKADNIAVIADRMADITKDCDARAKMGALCRADVLESYNLDKNKLKYLQVLQDI